MHVGLCSWAIGIAAAIAACYEHITRQVRYLRKLVVTGL